MTERAMLPSPVVLAVGLCLLGLSGVACTSKDEQATPAAPGQAKPAAKEPSEQALAVGKPAPDFKVTDQHGRPVSLAALRGKHVVLYFYPKDETPGCTAEAEGFRDAFASLSERGVVIIGVSTDSDESHRAFADNHKLPFTLVSDEKGTLAASYGVSVMFGLAQRHTFVIAPDGTLAKIYRDVNAKAHAQDIARDLQ